MILTKPQGQAELPFGYAPSFPDLFQVFYSCPMFFRAEIQQQIWFCFNQVTEPEPQGMGQFDQVSRFWLLDCACFELLYPAGIMTNCFTDVGA